MGSLAYVHLHGTKKRKPKRLYSLSVHRVSLNLHNIQVSPGRHMRVQIFRKAALVISISGIDARFVCTSLQTPFLCGFVFVVVALLRQRRVRCVPGPDTSYDDVGLYFRGELCGDGTDSLLFASTTSALNCYNRGHLNIPVDLSDTLNTPVSPP